MCSINHNLKAIFIHIPKNGGSYIASILQKYYGFKNYYLQRPDHNIICKGKDKSVKTHENKLYGTLIYYKTSNYINKIMGMNKYKWDTYYKFTFVRNPYDRIVSGWNYVNKYNINFNKFMDFNKIANSWDYWHTFMSQTSHIKDIDNKIKMNYIGKFENLELDLQHILYALGFRKILHLNDILNKKNSKKHEKYIEYYTDNNILNKVNLLIETDLINFNYDKFNDVVFLHKI